MKEVVNLKALVAAWTCSSAHGVTRARIVTLLVRCPYRIMDEDDAGLLSSWRSWGIAETETHVS